MAQQINLYLPELRRQKRSFSARTLAQSLAAVMSVLLAASAYQAIVLAGLRQDLGRVRGERDRIVAESGRLKAEAPRAPDAQLQAEAGRLAAAIAAQDLLLVRIDAGDFGLTEGLSPYFKALAHKTVDGVWLTLIRVDASTRNMALHGRVLRAELLPAYIERLGTAKPLQGHTFAQMRLATREGAAAAGAPPRIMEFELGTTLTAGGEK
ncbi:MAG: hypothetical protein OEW21_03960 [Betaproteobacteria bacterium]|nr:hypothetical protein [Betaproteobacteria bacterium]